MKKIRVIHCLGQLNTGGAETLVMNILRNINREKYQFDFLLFNQNKGFYDEEVKQLGSYLYYTSSMSSAGIISYVKQLIEFFKKEDVDVVHSHMDWLGGFIAYAAYKAGVKKIVVHSHANQNMFNRNIVYCLLVNISKYLIHKYAYVRIACSKDAGESLFGNDKFEVLYNGIDMNRYINPSLDKIEELRQEFNIKDTDIVLGHVGSFSLNKNQSFLIDIMNDLVKKNNNYKLILVGTGSTLQDIKNKVISLNLRNNVIFAGVRKEIPEIMHLFNMFLFPSIYEGLGIVAIEAQACGIPCLVSNTIPEEIDMKMNLISFNQLDKDIWIKDIKLNHIHNKDINKLLESKFNIDKTIEVLEEIY